MRRDIAIEIWRASREDSVRRWNIPALAVDHDCSWQRIWAAFDLAETLHGVYVARNPFVAEAWTALVPIRKKLLSGGYEIVPEEARDKYRR